MTQTPFAFADLFVQRVARSGYTPGQLGKLANLPKATLVNWLEGRVKHPRLIEDLLKVMTVLRLSEAEANQLLQAAGHPRLTELRSLAQSLPNPSLLELLNQWKQPVTEQEMGKPIPPPFQAIPDLPYFVGRERLLGEIRTALLDSTLGKIVILHGMAGVGKTAIAAHLAYQLRSYFPDGVLWARIDISDPMSILSTFAQAYRVQVSQYVDIASRSQVVRDLLASKRALIVLDNVDKSELVQPLLPPTGLCVVLITSRRRNLSVSRGNPRFSIGGFDTRSQESLQLFERILGVNRIKAEKKFLQEIAALLGQLPLAVDIAASRLAYEPDWSAEAFAQRLQREQKRLAELAFEDQSVRLSFRASYEAMPALTQQLFSILGIFSGEDFSIQTVTEVANIPLEDGQDLLRQLDSLSLIQTGRPNRYQLHPLLRDFARAQLSAETYAQVSQRWINSLVRYLIAHAADSTAIAFEQANLLAILQLAWEQKLWQPFAEGVVAMYHFWESRGHYELAQNQLHRALELLPETAPAETKAAIYRCLGQVTQKWGDDSLAESYYEQGLLLINRTHTPILSGALLRHLGVLAARRGDYALAEAYYHEGLTLTRQLEGEDTLSILLRGLGVQAFMRGDYLRAEALYEEGLLLSRPTSEKERQSSLYWALGLLAEDQGDVVQALHYLEDGLALARQLGHQERVSAILRDLALIYIEQEDWESAGTFLQEAIQIVRSLGDLSRLSGILVVAGKWQMAQGAWVAAEQTFTELQTIATQNQNPLLQAEALYGFAQLSASKGNLISALQLVQESLYLLKRMGHPKAMELMAWQARSLSPNQPMA